MAAKDFPGYLTDSRFINTGLSAVIFRKLSLNLNYNLRHTNVALDTMYANAPFSDNVNFSLGYQLNFNHSISLGLNMRGREDRGMPKQFDYKEYTARLSFQSRINRFAINLYGAYGKINNLLEKQAGETENILNGNLSLQYKIGDHILVKGFVSYQGGQQYIVDDFTQLYYGGVIQANWINKATIVLQYQNNYEVDEYNRDRSILALDANYLINKNNEYGVSVDYNLRKNSLNNTQHSASLNYTYIINLPV